MGYIKFNIVGKAQTSPQEQIINTNDYFTIRRGRGVFSNSYIDFIQKIVDTNKVSTPEGEVTSIRLTGSGFTEDTIKRFNQASIDANVSNAFQSVRAENGEVFEEIKYVIVDE